jgi:hypothetical protein
VSFSSDDYTTLLSYSGVNLTTSLAGIDKIQFFAEELVDQVRLIYNGMTCAKSQMLITSTGDTVFTRPLVEMVAP